MPIYEEQIRQLAEPLLSSEGMELVLAECLKMPTRWLVRIYMDREGGVTVDDCARISNQLGDLLDVHDVPPGPYTLEVSSPGLDRPLDRDKDFLKFAVSRIRLRLGEKERAAQFLRRSGRLRGQHCRESPCGAGGWPDLPDSPECGGQSQSGIHPMNDAGDPNRCLSNDHGGF